MAAPSVVTEYRGTGGALYRIVAYRKVTEREAARLIAQARRTAKLKPQRDGVYTLISLIGLNE